MKTKTLTLAVILAAMSTVAFATTDNSKKVANVTISPSATTGKLYVTYLGSEAADLTIKIINAKGRLISHDVVSGESNFRRPYDISNLQNGAYTMKLEEGNALLHESSFLVNNSKSAVRPIGEQKYQLTFKDGTTKDVHVSIYDKNGNLVFKEAIEQTSGFSKVFDMSLIASKGYTFEVFSEGIFELHQK